MFAINRDGKVGFDIFLDFSGRKELLISHRHNGLLYGLLKDGPRLEEIRRVYHRKQPGKAYQGMPRSITASNLLNGMIGHLLRLIDIHMEERGAVEKLPAA